MDNYSTLTVQRFHERLVASNILLRKSDIENIVKDVKTSHPSTSDIIRYQVAYEKAADLFYRVIPLRKMEAAYSGSWNGVEQRKAC